MPDIFLQGTTVVIRPIRPGAELEQIRIWRNDPQNMRLFFSSHEITPEEHSAWIEKVSSDPLRGAYAIADSASDEIVGNINFSFNEATNEATLGIMIGDKTSRGKGYGKDAVILLEKYIADHFNASVAIMEVFSTNENAILFYERIGYFCAEILRGEHEQDGQPCDVRVMKKNIAPLSERKS